MVVGVYRGESRLMMRPDPGLPTVYLCVEPVDFRKAIQGLSLLVEQELELNSFEAALFVSRIQIPSASQVRLLTQPYDHSLSGLEF